MNSAERDAICKVCPESRRDPERAASEGSRYATRCKLADRWIDSAFLRGTCPCDRWHEQYLQSAWEPAASRAALEAARGQQCRQKCLSYRHCPARAINGRAEFCAAAGEVPADWKVIAPEVLTTAADDWCPLGLWSGLDIAAVERQLPQVRGHGWQMRVRSQVDRCGAALRIAMKGLDRGAMVDRLEKIVESGLLEPEAAVQIAKAFAKT